MKTCNKCKVAKPTTEFHKCKTNKDGLRGDCNPCRNDYLKVWSRANPEKRRLQKYRHRYGIDELQYQALLIKQNCRCAICQVPNYAHKERYFLVDHDHRTGKVRGLLCRNCNTALGLFQDDFKTIGQAVHYLKQVK